MTEVKELEFYSSDEVAEIFHIHPATVRRWLIAKILRGKKVGKKWFIPAEDVERLRAEIKRGGNPSGPPLEHGASSFANARIAR